MELSRLSDRALAIHAAFGDAARRSGRAPWTSHDVLQGFVGDVGDLVKVAQAKAGIRTAAGDPQELLAHELSDCLWSVLVLARLHGIDLEAAYLRTMDGIEAKLQSAGR